MKKHIGKEEVKTLTKKAPIKSYFLLFSIIPIYLLFSLFNQYAVNMPLLDDWDAILGFINN
jgi:hypothetical protein